jgi:hypothetical protein
MMLGIDVMSAEYSLRISADIKKGIAVKNSIQGRSDKK